MTRFHLGVFWLAHANGHPCLLAEEAVRRGEVLRWWRVQRGSYLPQFLVFMLILVMTSSRRALMATPAVLQAPLFCLHARNHSLLAWLASYLTTSSGRVTPHGALRAYPRYCARMHLCCEAKIDTSN
jgi:hypothetical protein